MGDDPFAAIVGQVLGAIADSTSEVVDPPASHGTVDTGELTSNGLLARAAGRDDVEMILPSIAILDDAHGDQAEGAIRLLPAGGRADQVDDLRVLRAGGV